MTTRAVEQVGEWESHPFSGGYRGLHDLADERFSGIVTVGPTRLCMTKGSVVGILDGSIEAFEDASGTAHEAPSPALPLLAVMQDRADEVQGKYYTEDTPIEEVDSTLTDGNFTGFIELSENVLSGDYYVVYHQGRSMSVAYVGTQGQLLTDDEAFERANDEVGIYEARPVDIEVIEIPEPEGSAAGGAVETDPDPDPATAEADASSEADARADAGASADPASSPDPDPETGAETDTGGAGERSNDQPGGGPGDRSTGTDTQGSERTNEARTGQPSPDQQSGSRGQDSRQQRSDSQGQGAAGRQQGSNRAGGGGQPSQGARGRGRRQGGGESRRRQQPGSSGSPDPPSPEPVSTENVAGLETRSIPSLDPGQTNEPDGGTDSSPAPEPESRGQPPRDQNPQRSQSAQGRQAANQGRQQPNQGRQGAQNRQGPDQGRQGAQNRQGSDQRRQGQRSQPPQSGPQQPQGPEQGGRGNPSGGAGGPTPQQGPTEQGAGGDPANVEELESQLEDRESEIERLESQLESVEGERDELREERDELRERVEELERRINELRTEEGHESVADRRRLSPGEAIDGTNLFIRYRSKGEATLEKAYRGNAEATAVNDNLEIQHHTQFEADEVAVNGEPFEEFLRGTLQHAFVEWVVRVLPYEIRDTNHENALQDLYEALPRIDRAELNGAITVTYEDDGEEHRSQETYDIILRDRMGNPLAVANMNESRQPASENMMESLITSASRVGEVKGSLSGAFLVTSSFFEPGAMEAAEDATGSGLLSRDKRQSFVKLSRKDGFHLCLVEAREDQFNLSVPEL